MIIMSILRSTTFVDFASTTLYNNMTTTEITTMMPIGIRIPLLICMILIDISAFIGNLLVICAFYRTRRLQTVTNYFIASLAFADALVAIFVLPLSILHYQRDRSWKLGLILCDLWVSSDVLLCTSSILNLTCISVDRYMAITRPLTYTAYRSKFLARVMILLVWIVSVVITCPPIFGWRDSNRRHTVEQEHRCDLNTARGYVVYSALGSFYIPAVVMIFVYIRIFMVVYDRENLIKKFHDNSNVPIQTPVKTNPRGSINVQHFPDKINNKDPIKNPFCCCWLYFRKTPQENNLILTHQPLLPSLNNNISNSIRKKNDSFIYRFPNNNHIKASNSAPNSPPSISKATLLCRPCTISTKKMLNLSDELHHYRHNYLSGIAAEYQFRTGDSPCYELKTFQDSLPSSIKCRSHSFEELSTSNTHDLNTKFNHNKQSKKSTIDNSTNFNHKQSNEINDILLSNRENHEYINKLTQALNESNNDITQLSMIDQTKIYEINYPKRSPTILSKSSSVFNQNLTSSSTYSSIHDQKSFPEQTRINRRTKPSRLTKPTPSKILIKNFKQQYHITHHDNHSSMKSNRSSVSIHRITENDQKNSRCCCLTPFDNWCHKTSKEIYNDATNQSMTNEDDDDKLSSNDTNNRTPTIIASSSLRAIGNSNQNNILSPSHHHHHQLPSGTTANPSNDVNRRERIRFMKEQKTAKTLAVVVGGFILFWLPFFIMYIIPPEIYSFSNLTVTLITWLGYFNSVINPFIYAYCSKQFRMAFWNITFGICIKKSNALSPISVKKKQLYRHHMNG